MSKQPQLDHEIHPLLAQRWSPVGFDPNRPVPPADLAALFEAARWAASSYNEQPWRYLVASRDAPEAFERLLGCLVEGNQAWAQHAPVLALGLFKRARETTGQPNPAAPHDLGAASASLTVEATARGLAVHQMLGIVPETARARYAIPPKYEALTGLAIGYRAPPEMLDEKLAARDRRPRERIKLDEFVYGDRFGAPAQLG